MLTHFLLAPLLLAPPHLAPARPPESGQKLFNMYCARCHGHDGRSDTNGAHDLTKTNLNAAGRTYMVTNGFGKMPAFKSELTAAEVQRVVEYSFTLK